MKRIYRYTAAEEKFINENYPAMNRKQLAIELNRDEDSIRHKLKAMGLTSIKVVNIKFSGKSREEKERLEDAGRRRLLDFINSEYKNKTYEIAANAFIDIGRHKILNRYRQYSA